jgi:NADH-quinone oxidoreductase subunit D
MAAWFGGNDKKAASVLEIERRRFWMEGDDMIVDMSTPFVEHVAEGEDMVINMGPQHPSTHGVLRLELVADGEIVKKCTPHIGYLHRCFEKHAENLPYPEVIPFCDRMDYMASMNQDLAYCVAVEKLLKPKLPERVEYLRVICAELNRIASHLVALGTFGQDSGAVTPFLWCFRDREKILDLFEWLSGARMLYNYIWIGGVARDLPDGWVEKCSQFLDYFEPKLENLDNLLSFNKIFIERTATVGLVNVEDAIALGLSGPNLRASGLAWDLRKDDPYSIYDRFDFDIPVGTGQHGPLGSCWERYYVRVQECRESIKIIRQAIAGLPTGDVMEAVPKRVKLPKGEVYVRTESPKGELGFYIVSEGGHEPYRCKGRSPCFCQVSAMDHLCRGVFVADVIMILGSLDVVLGEIDR